MTFALCSRGHFNGIIASPVVFSIRAFFFFFFPRLSDSPSAHLSTFALDLCACTCVCACVRGFVCVLKQSNLLRLDQKKGSLGKLPGSGCVQALCTHA